MKTHSCLPERPVTDETFSTDTTGLDQCLAPEVVELAGGDTYHLRIGAVAKDLPGARVRMLAYNGSVPGPTLRVRQGSEITVVAHNDADADTTVHWHGLRLDNAFDGVPFETQPPIPVGGEFTYRLRFPDAGLYWYHPHLREDYGLDMGLYGCIVVDPVEDDYWPPASREAVVTLDDVLVEDGQMAPFRQDGPTHVAMGRYGNVMLTGGEPGLRLEARTGEVLRLYLVNTANTRLFNVRVPGAQVKMVGGDSGRCEHEQYVDGVLLAPSERAVVDVLIDAPGPLALVHDTPEQCYLLGTIDVSAEPGDPAAARAFHDLRTCAELTGERAALGPDRERAPDKVLAFESLMPLLYGDGATTSATSWTCPMHPEVRSPGPATCPSCGMKLIPGDPADVAGAPAEAAPSMAHHGGDDHAGDGHHAHDHGSGDGLEWEDLMPEINRASTAENMIWKLVDVETGAENAEIDWSFAVGDRVKIRLVNGMDQDHPMHHPFHVHGAGRFLVLNRDGQPDPNLVWKDTVLVRAGETVEILLDVTNPGLWMAHCHIAEHNQSGMMFSFPVHDTKEQ